MVQPIESLRAFRRVQLAPGETRHITLDVPVNQLAFYDVTTHAFKVEPGIFDILVGAASDDIRLRAQLNVTRVR